MFCQNTGTTRSSVFGSRDQYPYDEVVETQELINLRKNQSIFASGTGSTLTDGSESGIFSDFEPVKIKVQVLGLMNGIVMETTAKESQRIQDGTSNGLGDLPVFAVVTGFNEVNNKMKIAGTHLPSIPLDTPSYSTGRTHRFMAVWPADFDPQGNPTSCTTFTRKMKKIAIKSLEDVQPFDTKTCMYTTEKLVLAISLMRGKEMITLGSVNVHYTGTEKTGVQANLPVKVTREAVKKIAADVKGKKHKKQSSRKLKKDKRSFMQAQSFKGDPKRSYRIDEDALLTVMIETMKSPATTFNRSAANGPPGNITINNVNTIIDEDENDFAARMLDVRVDSGQLEFVEVMHQEEGNMVITEDIIDDHFEVDFHPTDEEGMGDQDDGNYITSGDESSFVETTSQPPSSFDESETLVPMDAGAHDLLTLPNLDTPYTLSLISSSRINEEECMTPSNNSATVQYIGGWD